MNCGVYILQCCNGRYYIGSTNDIHRRLSEHEGGKVEATKNILPVILKFFQKCSTLKEARRLLRILKSKKSRDIVERIITDQKIKLRW